MHLGVNNYVRPRVFHLSPRRIIHLQGEKTQLEKRRQNLKACEIYIEIVEDFILVVDFHDRQIVPTTRGIAFVYDGSEESVSVSRTIWILCEFREIDCLREGHVT